MEVQRQPQLACVVLTFSMTASSIFIHFEAEQNCFSSLTKKRILNVQLSSKKADKIECFFLAKLSKLDHFYYCEGLSLPPSLPHPSLHSKTKPLFQN